MVQWESTRLSLLLSLPVIDAVFFGKSLNLSMPQFPYLQK